MIKPTVGRVLWFYPSIAYAASMGMAYGVPGEPLTALIAHVINDNMVNLSVYDQNGMQFAVTSVPLLEENVPMADDSMNFHAVWMPYQKGQAAKAEALENKLSGDTPTPAQCSYGFNDRSFVTRDLVMSLISQGKPTEHIQHDVPLLLELIYGVDPAKAECDRGPDTELVHTSLSDAKRSAPPVDLIEQEIQAKGLTAPRITPAQVQANIRGECYFTAAQGWNGEAASDERTLGLVCPTDHPLQLLTFCVLVLQNGFTVTGESACASPENFDAEIGRKIARDNAVQKIWPLMGYELKQRMYKQQSAGYEAITTEGT